MSWAGKLGSRWSIHASNPNSFVTYSHFLAPSRYSDGASPALIRCKLSHQRPDGSACSCRRPRIHRSPLAFRCGEKSRATPLTQASPEFPAKQSAVRALRSTRFKASGFHDGKRGPTSYMLGHIRPHLEIGISFDFRTRLIDFLQASNSRSEPAEHMIWNRSCARACEINREERSVLRRTSPKAPEWGPAPSPAENPLSFGFPVGRFARTILWALKMSFMNPIAA